MRGSIYVFLLCFCFFLGCAVMHTKQNKNRMSDDRSLALRLLAARVTSAGRAKLESVFGTVTTVAPGGSSEDAPRGHVGRCHDCLAWPFAIHWGRHTPGQGPG